MRVTVEDSYVIFHYLTHTLTDIKPDLDDTCRVGGYCWPEEIYTTKKYWPGRLLQLDEGEGVTVTDDDDDDDDDDDLNV